MQLQSNLVLQRKFSTQIKRWAKNQPRELVKLFLQKMTFDALRRLVEKTPVDTGRARGGWIVTINFPSGWRPALEQSSEFGSDVAIERASQIIKTIPGFAVVYITNNVEYIGALEDGHSDQAPQGMLRLTYMELLQVFGK